MAIKDIGIMLDCSRNAVMNIESIKKMIDYLAKMGYTYLQLYTEDTYEVEDNPYFGYLRGKYTQKEIKEIDAYCKSKNIELIPCIQTLAHLNQIFRWWMYDNFRDCSDILLVGDDNTYKLIDDMFRSLSHSFSSRKVHIGMDEAHMVGLGKYLDRNGYKDRLSILLKHLNKVIEIATKYGFKPMMWSDMFFRLVNGGEYYGKKVNVTPKIKKLIPKNLELVYWDYYHTKKSDYDYMFKGHKQFDNKTIFAGGSWCWVGFTPHNTYSIKATLPAIKSANENGITSAFTTLWGDDGKECSFFSVLPSIFCFSEFCKDNYDMKIIKKKFYKLFNIKFDDFMKLDLPDKSKDNKCDHTNPSKYLLYNDLFLGSLDSTVRNNMGQEYRKKANILKRFSNNADFGYIFDMESKLCKALETKAELGIITRKYYQEKNIEELKKLIPVYKKLVKQIDSFYNAFETLWYKENKPFGFEIQDVRLGGLKQRVVHCQNVLEKYISGKIKNIPELDDALLTATCDNKFLGKQLTRNNWAQIISTSVISHGL